MEVKKKHLTFFKNLWRDFIAGAIQKHQEK